MSREDMVGRILQDSHVRNISTHERILHKLPFASKILVFFKVEAMVLPPFEIGDVKDSILDLDQVTIDQFSCEYQVIQQMSYTLAHSSC